MDGLITNLFDVLLHFLDHCNRYFFIKKSVQFE